jgi:hypothetical protein
MKIKRLFNAMLAVQRLGQPSKEGITEGRVVQGTHLSDNLVLPPSAKATDLLIRGDEVFKGEEPYYPFKKGDHILYQSMESQPSWRGVDLVSIAQVLAIIG